MSGSDLQSVFREAGARVTAALAARFRDLDLAEEAVAEAWAALAGWRGEAPRDPAAWLYAAAVRRAIDIRRRARTRAEAVFDPPAPEPTPEELLMEADQPIPDERLRLLFVCCHPALAPESRIALTLKTVGGLSVERIARAFLVPEPTLAQRLVRAKAKIKATGIPYEVPGPDAWPERLDALLVTLEVAYAQAHEDAALASDAAEFGLEVVRLSGVLAELLPHEPEVLALAALVRLAEARRPARLDDQGAMVPLTEQDPALWDARLQQAGEALLARASDFPGRGPYQLLAAIHAAHASRARTGLTPWPAILGLYDALLTYRPTPVTAVNRAVALAEVEGPLAGLAALAEAADQRNLEAWLPYQAARAGLLARAGRGAEAARAYDAALALSPGPAETLYLRGARAAL